MLLSDVEHRWIMLTLKTCLWEACIVKSAWLYCFFKNMYEADYLKCNRGKRFGFSPVRTGGDISQLSKGGWGVGGCREQVGLLPHSIQLWRQPSCRPEVPHARTQWVCAQRASAAAGREYTPPAAALHQPDAHDERLLQPTQAHTEPGQSG